MGFYSDIYIECVNPGKYYPWPMPQDLDCAAIVSKHIALTSYQLKKLGYSSKTLSRLAKTGVLHRYRVITPEGPLPSIYTAGNTAGIRALLPVPRFPYLDDLKTILTVNQVIVSIMMQTEVEININIRRPVQIIKVNNPLGIIVARNLDYASLPIKYNLNQAIAILADESLALPNIPFRYVLEEELRYDSLDINYYYKNETGLMPVDVPFKRKEDNITKDSEKMLSGKKS